jgi:hypothetical protein
VRRQPDAGRGVARHQPPYACALPRTVRRAPAARRQGRLRRARARCARGPGPGRPARPGVLSQVGLQVPSRDTAARGRRAAGPLGRGASGLGRRPPRGRSGPARRCASRGRRRRSRPRCGGGGRRGRWPAPCLEGICNRPPPTKKNDHEDHALPSFRRSLVLLARGSRRLRRRRRPGVSLSLARRAGP